MPPAIIGGVIAGVGALGAAAIGSHSASKAANVQQQADANAIAEQQRQYDLSRADFAPFRQAGVGALGQYGNLVGTNGAGPQSAAISALQASPYYQSLYRNGQEAVLQNASATGGLRGGNTQRSLADFGADTLAQTIQQQLGNLGGLIGVGEGATNSGAQLGGNAANAISNLLSSQGSAGAGAALASGGIWSGAINSLTGSINQALFPSRGFGGYTQTPVNPNAGEALNQFAYMQGF